MEAIHEASAEEPEKPHRHSYYTVIWAEEATGSHLVDFRTYPLQSGSLFFVAPGQIHQLMPHDKPKGAVILFSPEFLVRNDIREEFLTDLRLFRPCDDNSALRPQESFKQELTMLLGLMRYAYEHDTPRRLEKLGALLKFFLIRCHEEAMGRLEKEEDAPSRQGAGPVLLRKFKVEVEANFKVWHKVKEYADVLFITPGHLNDTVRLYLGETAKRYIQRRIVLEAQRMAMFTSKSAKEIAAELGYEDASHFGKIFKQQIGKTLKAFRKEQLNDK